MFGVSLGPSAGSSSAQGSNLSSRPEVRRIQTALESLLPEQLRELSQKVDEFVNCPQTEAEMSGAESNSLAETSSSRIVHFPSIFDLYLSPQVSKPEAREKLINFLRFYQNQEYNRLIISIEESLKNPEIFTDSELGILYSLKANAHLHLEAYTDAITFAKKGLEIQVLTDSEILCTLYVIQILACDQLGQDEDVLRIADKALTERGLFHPNIRRLFYLFKANAYKQLSRHEEALEAANEGLGIPGLIPSDRAGPLYEQQSSAFFSLNQFEDALQAANKGLSIPGFSRPGKLYLTKVQCLKQLAMNNDALRRTPAKFAFGCSPFLI